MSLLIIGIVFGPLIILFASVFLLQNNGHRILLVLSGVLFFFATFYLLIQPVELIHIHIPQIFWKLLALATATALFLLTIRDKQYSLMVLSLVQMLALILTEILLSPNEPSAFLHFDAEGKLILAAGAFILAILLPAAFSQQDLQHLQQGRRSKAFYAGILLWMAAFAGLLCAVSFTGLFMFAQWGYLGNLLIRKAFGETEKPKLVPVLQQSVLTLWIVASGLFYINRGTPAIPDLVGGQTTDGLLLVIVIAFIFVMGLLIPEKRLAMDNYLKPVSVVGLSMLLFSLLVPFSVLLKFRSLFLSLDHKLTYPVVFLGALLMAANAYYTGTARNDDEFVFRLVLFASGWGITSVFTGPESIYFTTGYFVAAALAFSFLIACNMAQNLIEKDGVEASCFPALTGLKAIVPLVFILPPFSCAFPGLVVIPMLKEYGLAMLLAITGLALLAAVIVRWTLPRLRARQVPDDNKKVLPGVFKYILPVFFILVVAVNLLSGLIYSFLQSQSGSLPAADFNDYVALPEMLRPGVLNAGSVFLGISAVLLMALYIVSGIGSRGISHGKTALTLTPYSLTTWLPAGIRVPLWIRAAWVTAATLLVGVALSCLKA